MTSNYHLISVLKDIRHYANKDKNITISEYDKWLKEKVTEAIGEPYLKVVQK